MPPALRSSPRKPMSTQTTPTSTPTRKAPHCQKCGRPRSGHPRSGCPFAGPEANNLTNAMTSMKLDASDSASDPEDTKAVVRQRRRQSQVPLPIAPAESLASITTSESELLNMLTNHIDTDTDTDDEEVKQKKIVHWQEAIIAAASPKKPKIPRIRELMPGTLVTPSPCSSQASSISEPPPPITTTYYYTPPSSQASTSSASSKDEAPPTPRLSAPAPTVTPKPNTLSRTTTMTDLERTSFISSLNKRYNPTTAYLLPKEDIIEVEAMALKHGYHTRRVASVETENSEQLLVVGQDPVDTNRFCETMEGRAKSIAASGSAKGSGFRTAASGMVVGAVAAVTTLAYA
ncbi:hypothetical protein BDZ89DRAFT_1068013 [Hymenopellis radicata]|nr:hypothetical protein BDZ89DRAFT_1068013 [Hymenopellis radicata]